MLRHVINIALYDLAVEESLGLNGATFAISGLALACGSYLVSMIMWLLYCLRARVCDGDPSSQYTRKLLADSLLAYYALKTVESTNLVKTKNLDLFKIIVIIIKGTYVRIIVKFDCYSYLNILSVGMLSSCFI